MKKKIFVQDKGKRNAVFLLLLVFFFPTITLINYLFEIQNGRISQLFRLINLSISFILIVEFVIRVKYNYKSYPKWNKEFLLKNTPFILFLVFWGIYLTRLIIDIEFYHLIDSSPYSKSYFYIYTIGVTLIPMLAAATINQLDFDFLHHTLHRFLVILNISLLLIYFFDRFYNHQEASRFYVNRNGFDYLNSITIAVCGSLLIFTSFLRTNKKFVTYLLITLGAFIVLTTVSRGPILSTLMTLLLILIFYDKKISIKYLYLTLALSISFIVNYLVSLIFAKYYITGNPLLQRLNNVLDDESTISRIKIYTDGIVQFLDGPLFGTHFLVVKSGMYSHNLLLDILLATGILGLLLIIPIFLIFARNLLSKPHNIFLSVIGFYLFFNTLTSGACYNMTEFWIIFVVIVLYKNKVIE